MTKPAVLLITVVALFAFITNTSIAQQPAQQVEQDAPKDATPTSLTDSTPDKFKPLLRTWERKDLPHLRNEITINAVKENGVADLIYRINGAVRPNVKSGLVFLDERGTINLEIKGVDFKWELKLDKKGELL